MEAEANAQEYAPPTQAEAWVFFDGEFKQYRDVHLGLMTHALHYGTGCFEGIRAYWNPNQEQLFALLMQPHFKRLRNSAKILQLDLPLTDQEMVDATVEILRPNAYRQAVDIRPLPSKSSDATPAPLHN